MEQKILIVDDEAIIAEHLKMILQSNGYNNVQLAHNKEKAIAALQTYQPDLVLLDIRMKNPGDGIDIAAYIQANNKIPFIFITAHSDNQILNKALEQKPSGYITKPFNEANVYAAINIALANLESREGEMLIIKDGFDLVKLDIHSILYVQSEGNYIDVYSESGKKSFRYSLEWFLQQVPEKLFMRVHRSYVVNLEKILKITGSVVMIQDQAIPVSRKSMPGLRSRVSQTL
ncbi:MAG: response regulator [Bacteroidia bacterium]|jgi:DNA-binding LytR/AlgR family response regulator